MPPTRFSAVLDASSGDPGAHALEARAGRVELLQRVSCVALSRERGQACASGGPTKKKNAKFGVRIGIARLVPSNEASTCRSLSQDLVKREYAPGHQIQAS